MKRYLPDQVAMKIPANHRVVFDVVAEGGESGHLNAHEIWIRARTHQPRLGVATVHRALARLAEIGAILRVDVPGAAATFYESASSPHAHFRCISCGRIDDIDYVIAPETLALLMERHSVEIDDQAVALSGKCRSCTTPNIGR